LSLKLLLSKKAPHTSQAKAFQPGAIQLMAKNKDEITENGQKKDWKFMLIMSLLVLLLLLAVGVGAYYIGTQIGGGSGEEPANGQTKEKKSGFSFGFTEYLGPLVQLEDFVVNITDGEQTRYLKLGITLETDSKKVKDEIESRLPQIRDAIIFQVSGKTFDQVRDQQGKKQLQAELIQSLNELLNTGRINNVFFTEFVVQ
jgi:flagellar FliL protein